MSLPVLRTLAAQCLKAQDGRGEWRPVRHAIAAMVADGTPHAIASDCAHAMADLAAHGTASGETITDACKAAGIVPSEDRAFGAVYSTLSRRGEIVFAGYCARRKGHGTAGGRLWALSGSRG